MLLFSLLPLLRSKKKKFIEFEKTACVDFTPIYHCTIYSDGSAEYNGLISSAVEKKQLSDKYTGNTSFKHKNPQTFKLSSTVMKRMAFMINKINYFKLEDEYKSNFANYPVTIITVYKDNKHKKIIAAETVPKELKDLLDTVHKIIMKHL